MGGGGEGAGEEVAEGDDGQARQVGGGWQGEDGQDGQADQRCKCNCDESWRRYSTMLMLMLLKRNKQQT